MRLGGIFCIPIALLIGCFSACGGGDMPPETGQSQAAKSPSSATAKILSSASTVEPAVNLQDAISVLKMIVGLDINSNGEPITAYQAYAADYDGNGKVELADAIAILKQIVGLTTDSPQWVLVDPLNSSLAGSANLNPGAIPSLPTATTQNIVAVLRGDVTGSPARIVSYADGMAMIEAFLPIARISGPSNAFAPVISNYTRENYKFDGSTSTDPAGKRLSYEWKMISAPAGFPGFSWGSPDRMQIGFWSGAGKYIVSLTVSNGTQTSLPATASVEVCCVADKSSLELNAFGFPIYGQDYIKQKFSDFQFKTLKDSLVFGEAYNLSAFQIDYLNGLEPGTTIKINDSLAGGATITGYSLPFKSIIQLPVDFTKIIYPDDFLAAKAVDVSIANPYCDLEPSKISYPSIFAGAYPLPEIKSSSTVNNYRRISYMPDHWNNNNPAYIRGCIESSRKAMEITFSRLRKLNFDTIVLSPSSIFDATNDKWRVLGPDATNSSIGDEDLKWQTASAKNAGLKVYWLNQNQMVQKSGIPLTFLEPNISNVLKSFDALDLYLEERGAFLQSIGVDGVMFPTNYWTNFENVLDPATFTARTVQMLKKLKLNFNGKILYDYSDSVSKSSELFDLIDEFQASLWGVNITQQEVLNMTVDLLKGKYISRINLIKGKTNSKPIIWEITTPSWVDYYWSSAFIDTSFCTAKMGSAPSNISEPCIQRDIPTDFSIQAITHEAGMEALSDSGALSNNGVAISRYWLDSNLFPSTTFPNLDSSIRGKPAEYILYKWFQQC